MISIVATEDVCELDQIVNQFVPREADTAIEIPVRASI